MVTLGLGHEVSHGEASLLNAGVTDQSEHGYVPAGDEHLTQSARPTDDGGLAAGIGPCNRPRVVR